MLKNSFSLFEVILSISILSLVISGFSYSTYNDVNTSQLFMKLNELENNFNTKNYSNMIKSSEYINIIIDKEEKILSVNKYTFENKNIKLFKYETK